ncbi:mechanosensitive ion channel domain-containing protein [Roseivirga sp.]|uniref:mechanosensitive ion channel domain-containing protein n=1 Tax=Roseivirga sp. TaxID=1964215 RepID=UPI003B8E5D4C
MDFKAIFSDIEFWISTHITELIISCVVLVLFFISKKVIRKLIQRHGDRHTFDKSRMLYVRKITGMVNFIVFAVFLGLTWEVSLSGLGIYFASIFTVVGVALFAHWSILSNLTASVILFFFFPYKVGSKIKILDGDNSVQGLILDITMFYIEIETDEGDKVSYPNNLALQKASFKLS